MFNTNISIEIYKISFLYCELILIKKGKNKNKKKNKLSENENFKIIGKQIQNKNKLKFICFLNLDIKNKKK